MIVQLDAIHIATQVSNPTRNQRRANPCLIPAPCNRPRRCQERGNPSDLLLAILGAPWISFARGRSFDSRNGAVVVFARHGPEPHAPEPSLTALSPFVCQFLRHPIQLSAGFTLEGKKAA